MCKACLDRARASRAHCFQLCSLFKERRKRKRRSTLMSPLIGQPARYPPLLRRRGAGGEAQAGRRSARRCDCAKAGCAVSWCIRHAPTCFARRAAAKQAQPPKPRPLTSTARARERCEHVISGLGSAARRCDAAGWLAWSHLDLAERLWRPPEEPEAATGSADR
jgi:hypothetical protein